MTERLKGKRVAIIAADQVEEVELVEPMGAETIVWCRLAGQTLSVRVEGESAIAPGSTLPVGFPIERVNLFDAKTGLRL